MTCDSGVPASSPVPSSLRQCPTWARPQAPRVTLWPPGRAYYLVGFVASVPGAWAGLALTPADSGLVGPGVLHG